MYFFTFSTEVYYKNNFIRGVILLSDYIIRDLFDLRDTLFCIMLYHFSFVDTSTNFGFIY